MGGNLDFDVFESRFLEDCKLMEEGAIAPAEIPATLSPEQYWAALAILSNPGISFLTGGAGTGKSRLLTYLATRPEFHDRVRVAAPTGTAALQVGGFTIHSLFGIKIWRGYPKLANPDNPRRGGYTPNLRLRVLQALQFLIIDEVSMVRADIMDTMDRALRNAKNNDLPFGGIKVLLIGDPFQLPPVQDRKWRGSKAEELYGAGYFFQSEVLQRAPFMRIRINEVHRQSDKAFSNALNELRLGVVTDDALGLINSAKITKSVPDGCLVLFPRNKDVDNYNSAKLEAQPGLERSYLAARTGTYLKKTDQGTFINSELADPLRLKVGAQVMFMKNDDQNPPRDPDGLPLYRWTNGTLGEVVSMSKGSIGVRYREPSGTEVTREIGASTWEDKIPVVSVWGTIEEETIGTFTQIPVRLAWGATIHKAQGATYSKVHIDLQSGTFQSGHSYVALSRVKDLNGLSMSSTFTRKNINPIDSEVLEFMSGDDYFEFELSDYNAAHKAFLKREEVRAKQEQRELAKAKAKLAKEEARLAELTELENQRSLAARVKFAETLEIRVEKAIAPLLQQNYLGAALMDLAITSPVFDHKSEPIWTAPTNRKERWVDIFVSMDASAFQALAKRRILQLERILRNRDFSIEFIHRLPAVHIPIFWAEIAQSSSLLSKYRTSEEASAAMRNAIIRGHFTEVNEYARILIAIIRDLEVRR